jgi:hypothetical protein
MTSYYKVGNLESGNKLESSLWCHYERLRVLKITVYSSLEIWKFLDQKFSNTLEKSQVMLLLWLGTSQKIVVSINLCVLEFSKRPPTQILEIFQLLDQKL